ncbi:MAG TPA: DUF4102 domain-containing protein, partial [Thiolapillus brandeum]|nr:DUF4102 domain-containing protein [Thiolapillus brandeum]
MSGFHAVCVGQHEERVAMALTDMAIRAAKPRERLYKLYDERGLYLEVTPKGSKRWRFRYRHPETGKERRISLGVYPDIKLKAARKRRDEAREMVAAGIDPSDARKMEKLSRKEATEGTFLAAAQDWNENHLSKKSPGHQERTWGILRRNVLPYIGDRPIREIKAP